VGGELSGLLLVYTKGAAKVSNGGGCTTCCFLHTIEQAISFLEKVFAVIKSTMGEISWMVPSSPEELVSTHQRKSMLLGQVHPTHSHQSNSPPSMVHTSMSMALVQCPWFS
jgi:hypothetical protein